MLDGDKPGWQRGWYAQHQRLIAAMASQKRRAAAIVAGDFHAAAAEKLTRSGELVLEQPVHVVLSGPLGTGDMGFPSAYRVVESSPSLLLRSEQAEGSHREDRLHCHRGHARRDDVFGLHLAPTAVDRRDRHDGTGHRLHRAATRLRISPCRT